MKARGSFHLHMPGFESSPHLDSIVLMLPDCILLFPGQGQHYSACSALYSVLPLYPGSSRQVSISRGRGLSNSARNVSPPALKAEPAGHLELPLVPATSRERFDLWGLVGHGWEWVGRKAKRKKAI